MRFDSTIAHVSPRMTRSPNVSLEDISARSLGDDKTSRTLPIVIGCTFAGVVFIVCALLLRHILLRRRLRASKVLDRYAARPFNSVSGPSNVGHECTVYDIHASSALSLPKRLLSGLSTSQPVAPKLESSETDMASPPYQTAWLDNQFTAEPDVDLPNSPFASKSSSMPPPPFPSSTTSHIDLEPTTEYRRRDARPNDDLVMDNSTVPTTAATATPDVPTGTRQLPAPVPATKPHRKKGKEILLEVQQAETSDAPAPPPPYSQEVAGSSSTQLPLAGTNDVTDTMHQCNFPPDNEPVRTLEDREKLGVSWEERAKNVLTQSRKAIAELDELVNMDPSIPMDPIVLSRLMSARKVAKDFETQATAWLVSSQPTKPMLSQVTALCALAVKDYKIPAIKRLEKLTSYGLSLESRCELVLENRYKPGMENVFDTSRRWKEYTEEHLANLFQLPSFDKLNAELTNHRQWLQTLPWYCIDHQELHGGPVLQDVLDTTRPEEDMAPTDKFFTCICDVAVRPPPPGTVSDAIQCEHCAARFHGVCARNCGSCPFCEHHHWDGSLQRERPWHACSFPDILANAPSITKNYSEDWKELDIIVRNVERLSSKIGDFLTYSLDPANQNPEELLPQVRHYMRKLYKLKFLVSPTADGSYGLDLARLHRVLASQPAPVRVRKGRRPETIVGQDVDEDWTDGTRCICRGRKPVLQGCPTSLCLKCKRLYHNECVFYPGETTRLTCPLGCLRKDKAYPYSDVRVTPLGAEAGVALDTYIKTHEMLDTASKDVIYQELPPPRPKTIFVELVQFTPRQPEADDPSTSAARSAPPQEDNTSCDPPASPSSLSNSTVADPEWPCSNAMTSTVPPPSKVTHSSEATTTAALSVKAHDI